MAKYSKYIFLAAALLLIIATVAVFKKHLDKVSFHLKENEVIIQNFEMGKVLDEQNDFYKVSAKEAKLNNDKGVAYLTDFAAHYKKRKIHVDMYAHKGILEKEFLVTVKGKIKGRINDIEFQTPSNGFFYYDFLTGIGTLLGQARFVHQEGGIQADKIVIYTKNNYAEFIGHVKVVYNK